MEQQNSFAEEAVGVSPPRGFLDISVLDASVLDGKETADILREDVRLNRIEYVFPEGLGQVDLFEECRALTRIDDFDTMYDLTMQMLVGKPVVIRLKCMDGSRTELCGFQVVDRYQNLRAIEAIDKYPCLVTWLTEFIGVCIAKKFPVPLRTAPPQRAREKTAGAAKKAATAAAT
jgi:hypothetical protein